MHGDFSRLTFDSRDRFSAVIAQQGRASVDAAASAEDVMDLRSIATGR